MATYESLFTVLVKFTCYVTLLSCTDHTFTFSSKRGPYRYGDTPVVRRCWHYTKRPQRKKLPWLSSRSQPQVRIEIFIINKNLSAYGIHGYCWKCSASVVLLMRMYLFPCVLQGNSHGHCQRWKLDVCPKEQIMGTESRHHPIEKTDRQTSLYVDS